MSDRLHLLWKSFADNPPRIVAILCNALQGSKTMAAIGAGGRTNQALFVAYIFIGVA
jgi:hypothetical protein